MRAKCERSSQRRRYWYILVDKDFVYWQLLHEFCVDSTAKTLVDESIVYQEILVGIFGADHGLLRIIVIRSDELVFGVYSER
jgi:hypothetical protein